MRDLGDELNAHRSALMRERQEGLTKTYNRLHDPDEHADDIVRLREPHVALDYEVRDAYGWNDRCTPPNVSGSGTIAAPLPV